MWKKVFDKVENGFHMNNDFYHNYNGKYDDENYGDNDDEDKSRELHHRCLWDLLQNTVVWRVIVLNLIMKKGSAE